MRIKGLIKKIILTNFITYEHIEIEPNPKMNMIIGPNGSGKSSILCALCLGLAGKPKSIGRVTKLGDYVKTGCNQAIIHIELEDGTGKNLIITRIITAEGSSTWSLNGRTCGQKVIEETVSKMNIHMDNLCQFLSQERVQDFSKMNAKELLLNTQRTVGAQEMSNYHTKLVELCKSFYAQEKNLAALEASLEREEQKAETLRVRMESMKERLEIMQKIKNLQTKRPWIVYNKHLLKIEKAKEDYKAAVENLKEKKKDLVPIEQAIALTRHRMDTLANSCKTIPKPGTALQNQMDTQDQLMQRMVRNHQELVDKEQEDANRVSQLAISDQKYQQLDSEAIEYAKTINVDDFNKKINEAGKETQILEDKIQAISMSRRCKNQAVDSINRELADIQQKRESISNKETLKWSNLKRRDPGAYTASRWIMENSKHELIEGMTFPAIMLTINMTRFISDGRYLEMLIPWSDKKALLCEHTDDMNRLVPYLKNGLNVKINMVQSPNEVLAPTPKGRSKLKRLGFDAFVTDLFTAPTPVINYLCRSRGLHNIPVAARADQITEDSASAEFSRYFAGNYFYVINTSKYSSYKSTKLIPITKYNSFEHSADPIDTKKTEAKEKVLKQQLGVVQAEADAYTEKIQALEVVREKHKAIKKSLKDKIAHMNKLITDKSRVKARMNALHTQAKTCDIISFRQKCVAQNKALVQECVRDLIKLTDLVKGDMDNEVQVLLSKAEDRYLHHKVVIQENILKDMRGTLKDYEKLADDLKKMSEECKRQGHRLLKEAREVTGTSPGEPAFVKFQEIFQLLPDTIEEIDSSVRDYEGRLEFYGTDTNSNVIDEYDKQKDKVESMKEEIKEGVAYKEMQKQNMTEIRDKWLPQLRTLATNISDKFGSLFEYMKCVGEVVLVEGDPALENDYENYGLQIRVKFRADEPLRDLSGAQSGGERSVSTAIYLLALQELTNVPFRCMDEINQGMDPTNERRIMTLMMKLSDSPESCQYFVVTPKLLPNLRYAASAKVMCVCQPKRFDTSKWNMGNFIYFAKKARKGKTGKSSKRARKS